MHQAAQGWLVLCRRQEFGCHCWLVQQCVGFTASLTRKPGFDRALAIMAVLVLCARPAVAAEPDLTTDSILARWEQASRKHRSLDVAFQRVDRPGPQGPEDRRHGRFYWEAPNRGFYHAGREIWGDYLIWNDGRLRVVDVAKKSYYDFSHRQLQRMKKRMAALHQQSLWGRISTAVSSWPGLLSDAADVLPLMTDMTADAVRQRFHVKWELRDDGILVTLMPKDPAEARRCNQLDLLLDRDSWEVTAQRMIDPAGHETIHTFDRTDINVPPADRDSLLLPDLDGYRPVEWTLDGVGTGF